MKTNLGIELTDDERDALANLIDGKDTTRLATRKEITAIAQRHIGGMARHAEALTFEEVEEEDQDPGVQVGSTGDLYRVDMDDPLSRTMAKPEDPSYVRGWNQARNS